MALQRNAKCFSILNGEELICSSLSLSLWIVLNSCVCVCVCELFWTHFAPAFLLFHTDVTNDEFVCDAYSQCEVKV